MTSTVGGTHTPILAPGGKGYPFHHGEIEMAASSEQVQVEAAPQPGSGVDEDALDLMGLGGGGLSLGPGLAMVPRPSLRPGAGGRSRGSATSAVPEAAVRRQQPAASLGLAFGSGGEDEELDFTDAVGMAAFGMSAGTSAGPNLHRTWGGPSAAAAAVAPAASTTASQKRAAPRGRSLFGFDPLGEDGDGDVAGPGASGLGPPVAAAAAGRTVAAAGRLAGRPGPPAAIAHLSAALARSQPMAPPAQANMAGSDDGDWGNDF